MAPHEQSERDVPVMPQNAGAPNPPQPPAGPAGSPMAQPTPNDGARQMGMVQVETAMQMLEKALPVLGSNTPEGKSCLAALSGLSKHFNRQQAQGLVPAQIAEMARAQQQSPIAKLMSQGQGQAAPQGGGAEPAPMPMAA